MKIVVITPNFTIAGVPLAQLRFAESFSRFGFNVDLIIGNVGEGYILPEVKNVNVIILNKNTVSGMFLPICEYLRKNKPDIIFSAEDHLNSVVLLSSIITNCKAKISCSSRVTPYDTYSDKFLTKRWILKQLTKLVSWRADVLTCVSSGMIDEYEKVFNKKTKHVCVHNIIDISNLEDKMKEEFEDNWFKEDGYIKLVAAGRLAHWKAYDKLIYSISNLNPKYKVKLLILGDGPEKESLQELIDKLNLSNTIKLEGYVTNPIKYFLASDIFVHTSIVESLGNVLVEAMICGCTVVSTDAPTGPREILNYGQYGYLAEVDNPISIVKKIELAIENPISKELLLKAVERFSEETIINKHLELLNINKRVINENNI